MSKPTPKIESYYGVIRIHIPNRVWTVQDALSFVKTLKQAIIDTEKHIDLRTHTTTIPRFPNYNIAENGDICGNQRGQKPLKPDKSGYVVLHHGGNTTRIRLGRLMLETFIGPCPIGQHCVNIDGCKTHNALVNLKWGIRTRGPSKHHLQKLSDIQRAWITIALKSKSATQRELARQYEVSQATISRLKQSLKQPPVRT